MGLVSLNPLLMERGRKNMGLRVLCAILSLVLPGVVLYFVPLLLKGVVAIGMLVAMLTYSWQAGIATLPLVYMAFVTLTWEGLKFVQKKYLR
jgi:hypothetical protein